VIEERRRVPVGQMTSTEAPTCCAWATTSALPPWPPEGLPSHTASSRSLRVTSASLAATYASRPEVSNGMNCIDLDGKRGGEGTAVR
jgi:hypothetical protein